MRTNELLYKWVTLLFVCFPPLVVLFIITRYSVNIPYLDHWDGFLDVYCAMEDKGLEFSHFWRQQNEHRLIFPKIIMLVLAAFTHWNVICEQYFSLFTQACTLLLIFFMSKKTLLPTENLLSNFFKIVTSLMMFSMVQYKNWAWGWPFHIFLNVFAVCFTCSVMAHWKGNWKGLLLLTAGTLVATYSYASGIVLWGIVFIWLLFSDSGRRRPLFVLFWIVMACIVFFSYMYHYEKPAYHPSLMTIIEHPLIFLAYFFSFIGSPFGMGFVQPASILFGIFGVAVLFCLVFFAYIQGHHDMFKRSFPWFGIISYVILCACITGIGRSSLGVSQALASRYTTISILFWISLFVMALSYIPVFLRHNKSLCRKYTSAIITLILFFLVSFYAMSYEYGVSYFKKHNFLLTRLHSLLQYNRHYGSDSMLTLLHPSKDYLLNSINILRQRKIGPFYNEISNSDGIYISGSYAGTLGNLHAKSWMQGDVTKIDSNTQISFQIDAPASGLYQFSAIIGFSPKLGFVSFKIDDMTVGKTDCKTINSRNLSQKLRRVNYGAVSLSKGSHKLTVLCNNDPIVIGALTFKQSMQNTDVSRKY